MSRRKWVAMAAVAWMILQDTSASAQSVDGVLTAAAALRAYEASVERCAYEPIVKQALDRLRDHYAETEPYRWRRAWRESKDAADIMRNFGSLLAQGTPYTLDPNAAGERARRSPAEVDCSSQGLAVGAALPAAGLLIGFDPQLFSEAGRLASGKGRPLTPANENVVELQKRDSTGNVSANPSSQAAAPQATLSPSDGRPAASSTTGIQANATGRPLLGVEIQKKTIESGEKRGTVSSVGVLIANVTPHSPADRAGLLANDLIVTVNDRYVIDKDDLVSQLHAIGVGGETRLDILRTGTQRLTKSAKLVRVPDIGSRAALVVNSASPLRGATIIDSLPGAVGQVSASGGAGPASGVAVESFREGSEAARAGFRKGDIITSVNGTPIASVAALNEVLNERPLRWVISLDRGTEHLTIVSNRQ